MRAPAARIEEKATIVKLFVQAETGMKRGMFAKERAESLVVKPGLFLSWPFGDKTRIGNVRNREARDPRGYSPYAPHGRSEGIGGGGDVKTQSVIYQNAKTPFIIHFPNHPNKPACMRTFDPYRGQRHGKWNQRTNGASQAHERLVTSGGTSSHDCREAVDRTSTVWVRLVRSFGT